MTPSGGVFDPSSLQHMNVRATARKGDLDAAIERARTLMQGAPASTAPMLADDLKMLMALKANGGIAPNPGHMYEVNLNTTPDRLLDWDAHVNAQSPNVSGPLANIRESLPPDYWFNHERVPGGQVIGSLRAAARDGVIPNPTGNADAAATETLRNVGIPGIKYLDAGSRGAGEGTSNYVMFDPKLIEIMRKYAVPGAVAGGAAAPFGWGAPEQ